MGLYRLQVSQHQLQKDVTHQFSRFLVNRRDDEADFSDMLHIFFRSGLFSHGVLLSQMQNKIIVLPVVHWENKQASTLAGAFLPRFLRSVSEKINLCCQEKMLDVVFERTQ